MGSEDGVEKQLEEVLALYERGLYLQAWEQGKSLGENPKNWPTVEGQLLGGRVMMNLGGTRDARLQHIRTWRANPNHVEATYYHVFALLELSLIHI